MVRGWSKPLTLKEEDTRNRIIREDLADALKPHGFTLSVTEFDDHCIIHQNYYATELYHTPELLCH